MTRAALIEKLTPAKRYTSTDDTLQPLRTRQYLFAATTTNAGYLLLTDEYGRLQPLTINLLGVLVRVVELDECPLVGATTTWDIWLRRWG